LKTTLALRPIEKTDLETIQFWRNNKSVLPFVREYRLMTKSHVESWYSNMILSDKHEMFIIQDDGHPVGICGLTYINWQNRHADLHFAIYDEFSWIDDVYAPRSYEMISEYAFQYLNLNKIYVEIYENDEKKLNFFKECRFTEDARLRQHYYNNGKYHDSIIMSLLKSEWSE